MNEESSQHLSTASLLLEVMRKLAVEHGNCVDSDTLSVTVEHLSIKAMAEIELAMNLG